jgi:hypothetical protein
MDAMKLNHIVPQHFNGRLIHQFGDAKLVRHRNGQHELLGGTAADRTAAFEWASLFAHEIVFTHFLGRTDLPGHRGLCLHHLLAPVA